MQSHISHNSYTPFKGQAQLIFKYSVSFVFRSRQESQEKDENYGFLSKKDLTFL